MAELNEKQLGLLNSLIYLDADYAPGKSMEDVIADIRESGVLDRSDLGGGLTKQNAVDLLEAIEGDKALMALKVDSSVDTEIRGVCFVDTNTKEATIAFRGTGPAYAAWDDNCQGGYLADTDMQKEALDFAKSCAGRYDDITVSGHSKGGNMAQYVTVLMGDEIDRCVSFDGQGFGDEFRKKYAEEIAANKDKIRSVCAYNDFVNILLEPITDNIIYLDNDARGKGGHFIYTMITDSNNEMDANGEFIQTRDQGFLAAGIKEVLNDLLNTIDMFGNDLNEYLIYTLAGTLMGAIMGTEGKSLEEILQELKDNAADFIESVFEELFPHLQVTPVKFSVDTQILRGCGNNLVRAAGQIDLLRSEVSRIQKRMATNLIDGISIGAPLRLVLNQFNQEIRKLEKLASALQTCANIYDSEENKAKGCIN